MEDTFGETDTKQRCHHKLILVIVNNMETYGNLSSRMYLVLRNSPKRLISWFIWGYETTIKAGWLSTEPKTCKNVEVIWGCSWREGHSQLSKQYSNSWAVPPSDCCNLPEGGRKLTPASVPELLWDGPFPSRPQLKHVRKQTAKVGLLCFSVLDGFRRTELDLYPHKNETEEGSFINQFFSPVLYNWVVVIIKISDFEFIPSIEEQKKEYNNCWIFFYFHHLFGFSHYYI